MTASDSQPPPVPSAPAIPPPPSSAPSPSSATGIPPDPAVRDAEHLRLLSVFHYVFAGMMALFACFPLLHLALGLFFLLAPAEAFEAPQRPAPPSTHADHSGHDTPPVEVERRPRPDGPERDRPPARSEASAAPSSHGVAGNDLVVARFVGGAFVAMAGTFILLGWTIAVLAFIAGRHLARRHRYRFCFAVAAIECVVVPIGTVLGAFTLVVLSRESVRARFGLAPADTPA